MVPGNSSDDALYRLEERAYGEVIDAIRASGLPDGEVRRRCGQVMELLHDAQSEAGGSGLFDEAKYERALDAIVDAVGERPAT